MASANTNTTTNVIRIRVLYGALMFVMVLVGLRLFYLQIIKHDYYRTAALNDQLKQYQIPAQRGTIEAYSGNTTLPIVLNQQLYVLYADPQYIKNADDAGRKVAQVIGGDEARYAARMKTKGTRYVVLAKKLSPEQSKRLRALKLAGLGTVAQNYRTYPQGVMAAQLLGFVNDEGQGSYGLEEAFNAKLKGTAGELKAITDAAGVPLAASKDNVRTPAKNGDKLVLTIDLAIQQQVENILEQGMKDSKAEGVSAVVMDPTTGAVKAMANLPSYDPSRYFDVDNASLFQNPAVTNAIEVGSTMKTLTTAAALDQGVIRPETTYYDPASWRVDDFTITNIEEDGGAGTRSVRDILNLSLNTGVTWELMQMGGGQLNFKGRNAWYNYLTQHYMFGKKTGIEQGYESAGYVPKPEDNGAGINLTYANTAFGQAMTATPIQMAAALAAVVNGGTYYQPRLVDRTVAYDGTVHTHKPEVLKRNVVSQQTAAAVLPMMQYVVDNHNFRPSFNQAVYSVGGKTGTAQIAKPGGGYYDNEFNGTYAGFVGGDKPEYVIVVFVHKPKIAGYAGMAAAQPIFGKIAHMLINNSYVTPKR